MKLYYTFKEIYSMSRRKQFFFYLLYFSYILFFFITIGLLNYSNTKYYTYIRQFIMIYVSLIILYSYNPFKKNRKKYTNAVDKLIIFYSGFFLFITSGVLSILEHFIHYNCGEKLLDVLY